MTEKQLWALLISVLKAGYTAAGFNVTNPAGAAYVDIRQGAQPTLTGRPDGMAVLLYSQSERRYGWTQRKNAVPAHTETQKMESLFQVSTLAPQNPKSPTYMTDPTARDLAIRGAAIMQSSATIATLQAAHVGIYRVTDVRNMYFQSDRDAEEGKPSFDFTIDWNLIDASTVAPITPPIAAGLYPV